MLHRRGSLGPARYAVTDRRGGVSAPPYDGLDLGDHVGDDPAAVAENRRLLAAELGLAPDRLVFMRQVHGRDVVVVEDRPDGGVTGSPPVEADALVTGLRGVGLVVLVADCVPVLLAGRGAGGPVLGVVHAGRKGVQAGVVTAAVDAMDSLGAQPEGTSALVGPAVCGRCYEVPAALRSEVAATAPTARATSWAGNPALDLPAAVAAELAAAGVRDVETDPACSMEETALFSHRRSGGRTGRFAGVVWVPADGTAPR